MLHLEKIVFQAFSYEYITQLDENVDVKTLFIINIAKKKIETFSWDNDFMKYFVTDLLNYILNGVVLN
jgi:hypothetical protein